MYQKKQLFCLLLACTLSNAKSLTFKPKVGVQVTQLNLGSSAVQKQPVLELENPVFNFDSSTTYAANGFLFNATGRRGSISKDNIDGVFITQALLGLQIGASGEPERPNDHFSYSPVLNIYGLLEDQQKHAIQADRFVISPLSTIGGDIGLELARSGSYLQFGIGGQLYRCEYQSGLLFASMALINSSTVDDIDVTSLQATDKKPFVAKIDPFILPYLYTEISAEVGDIASISLKLKYGMDASPKFKNSDPTLEMFSKDPNGYASNSEWQLNAASLGLKVRLEDLF